MAQELERAPLTPSFVQEYLSQIAGIDISLDEAEAIICDDMHETARGGASYNEVMAAGASAISLDDVIDGVDALVPIVRIECLFDDGARVVAVEQPIRPPVGVTA